MASDGTAYAALVAWIDQFVDFLTTKHGLATALRSDNPRFDALHGLFLDRLVPVCAQLLAAAAQSGEVRDGLDAYELMRAVGNLCAGVEGDAHYDARHVVGLLVAGLAQPSRAPRRQPSARGGRGTKKATRR